MSSRPNVSEDALRAGRGACPGPLSLRSALGAWLAREGSGEEDCLRLLGVGRETLARIVDGGVEPEAELAEKIWAAVRHPLQAPAVTVGAALQRCGDGWGIAFFPKSGPILLPVEEVRALTIEAAPLIAEYDERFPS